MGERDARHRNFLSGSTVGIHLRLSRFSLLSACVCLLGLSLVAPANGVAAETPTAVIDQPLLPKQAKRNHERWARKGYYPAPPWLAGDRAKAPARIPAGKAPGLSKHRRKELKNAPQPEFGDAGERIRLSSSTKLGDPPDHPRLFGYEGEFFSKRNDILAWVQAFYRNYVPGAGGTYVPPPLFEVVDGTPDPNCGGFPIQMHYCSGGNNIAWGTGFSQELWYGIGDMAWAVAIAHEYGHGSQQWLGYGNSGYFQYILYREYFADCMAGAWTYYAYEHDGLDNVGFGDGNEFKLVFQRIAVSHTDWSTHGDFNWRYGSGIYGWNYGFDGCISQGNWISRQ